MCCGLNNIRRELNPCFLAKYPCFSKFSATDKELSQAMKIVEECSRGEKSCSGKTCNLGIQEEYIRLHIQLGSFGGYSFHQLEQEKKQKDLHIVFFFHILKAIRIANKTDCRQVWCSKDNKFIPLLNTKHDGYIVIVPLNEKL